MFSWERRRMEPVLFTTGYEQHRTTDSLIAALHGAQVELLVDVRDLPLSRRRGFSKTALANALADAGVEYEHHRALGNPKPLRDLYRSGRKDEGEKRYRAHLRDGCAVAVDQLAEQLQTRRTCVLCFEKDHHVCHRAVIVEELHERVDGLRLEHL